MGSSRECPICGTVVETRRADARCCSDGCRAEYHLLRAILDGKHGRHGCIHDLWEGIARRGGFIEQFLAYKNRPKTAAELRAKTISRHVLYRDGVKTLD